MTNEKFMSEDWTVACNGNVVFVVVSGTEKENIPDVICSCGINNIYKRAKAEFISVAPEMYRKLDELKNIFITFSYRLLEVKENKNAEQWMKKAMEIEKLLKKARGEE